MYIIESLYYKDYIYITYYEGCETSPLCFMGDGFEYYRDVYNDKFAYLRDKNNLIHDKAFELRQSEFRLKIREMRG